MLDVTENRVTERVESDQREDQKHLSVGVD